MRTATITVDVAQTSVSRSLASLARASARDGGLLVCVTVRAYLDLVAELGSDEAAVRRLLTIATNTGRPICVNLPTEDGSRTIFVAPKDWTQERLAGWAAGHHEELEAMFGPATVRRREDL